jgi:hypothetical protein
MGNAGILNDNAQLDGSKKTGLTRTLIRGCESWLAVMPLGGRYLVPGRWR